MAFEAIAGPIAGSIASKAISGATGGKGGGGKGGGSSTGENIFRQVQNFAPFQQGAIDGVFDVLGGGAGEDLLLGGTGRDSLLQVPEQASGALSNALGFANDLIRGGSRSEQELRSFEELINSEFTRQPFDATIDDIEGLRGRIVATFDPFVARTSALADEGINTEFRDLLLETAQRDPASNPFVDRLVGDVSTDVGNAVRDQFIASGGLEASAAADAIGRETGRISNQIRTAAFESEAARALQAQQAGANFDAQNAAQRLNALIGGSNIASSGFGLQLGAQNQINALTRAQEQLRANAIAARGDVAAQLASLPLAGLNAVGPLAEQFTELPFVPLANFSEIAFAPLGSTTVQSGSNQTLANPSIFDTARRVIDLGRLGAGILDRAGVFGTDPTGGIDFDTDFSGGGLSTPILGAGNNDFDNFGFTFNPFGATTGVFGSGLFT